MPDEARDALHVDAAPEVCFAVAADFEAYPRWARDVKFVRVVTRDDVGRATQVDFRVAALGRNVRYVLDYDYGESPGRLAWTLVEGDLLHALDGEYLFDAAGDGTDVAYRLAVDLAVPLPGLVKRRAAQRIVTAALTELKREVEAGGERDAHSEAPVADPVRDTFDGAVPFDEAGREPRALPPSSMVEDVVADLLGALPEVRDHLLTAADELLGAARALLQAADHAVRGPHEDS
jgi:Polyketide cyclase / dehydrase and lipid transport